MAVDGLPGTEHDAEPARDVGPPDVLRERIDIPALLSDVLSEWHYDHERIGTPEHARHSSFSDALALTHCICWGAGYRVAARLAEVGVEYTRLAEALEACAKLNCAKPQRGKHYKDEVYCGTCTSCRARAALCDVLGQGR